MLSCETGESSLAKDSMCGSVLRILTAPRQLVIINNSFYMLQLAIFQKEFSYLDDHIYEQMLLLFLMSYR